MIVVVDVEGVLAERGQKLPSASSSDHGMLLYHHLRGNKTALVMLSEERKVQPVKDWLLKENASDYIQLTCRGTSLLEPREWRIDAVKRLISQGSHISFYVGSDPTIAGEMNDLGVTYLLVVPANGRAGKINPDVPYRTWDDLTDTLEEEILGEAQMKQALQTTDGD